MNQKKQPLLVHFVFHPESAGAREMARAIHREFNQEAVVPGLRIPTVFSPATENFARRRGLHSDWRRRTSWWFWPTTAW